MHMEIEQPIPPIAITEGLAYIDHKIFERMEELVRCGLCVPDAALRAAGEYSASRQTYENAIVNWAITQPIKIIVSREQAVIALRGEKNNA